MMNDRIRIADADREQVAARLREHFAEGRLNQDELDERIAATFSAKTAGDLRRVMADLPGPAPESPPWAGPPWAGGPWAGGPRAAGPWAGGPHVGYRRRRPRILPLLLLVLIAVLVLPGAGLVVGMLLKLLLLFWLVAIVAGIIAAVSFRHRMRRYWRSGPGSYWERFQEHMR
jgi:hypothetical protein